MQQITSQIPRTEQAIFNLICNIDELHALKHELSIQDMKQIEQELEKLRSVIFEMLAESSIEKVREWVIHNYSGFGDLKLGVFEGIELIAKVAKFILEHGDLGLALLSKYPLEYAQVLLKEFYQGAYDSANEYEAIIFGECYHAMTNVVIPMSLIRYYIRENFFPHLRARNYFSVEAQGQTHIFMHY